MADDRQFQCKRCSFKAHTKKQVIRHVLDSHSSTLTSEQIEDMQAFLDGKNYKCTFCGLWVTTRRQLMKHALDEHEAELTVEQANSFRQSLGIAIE